MSDVYHLYRSVTPSQFEKKKGKPRPTAFHRRQNEQTLSVWDAAQVTPRQVLQKYLDEVLPALNAEDEQERRKAENRVKANGATPEAMYDNGWRIVQVPESAFAAVALPVAPPRADGHRDVIGSIEAFEESAFALVEASVVLTREETLT